MFLVLFEQFIQVGLYLGEKGWGGAYIRVRLILGMLTGQHIWGAYIWVGGIYPDQINRIFQCIKIVQLSQASSILTEYKLSVNLCMLPE